MKFYLKKSNVALIAIFFLLMVNTITQGCSSQYGFKIVDSLFTQNSSSGNGTTYDGKLVVILHNIVDGFKCENRLVPQSILYRDASSNWYYTENQPDKCNAIYQQPVSNIQYDENTQVATYNGAHYVPPIVLKVEANEDANLPDIDWKDGICADINAKCSLWAAFQQANQLSFTVQTQIDIPAGTYTLNQAMALVNSNRILVNGDQNGATIFDGNNSTTILGIFGPAGGSTVISNITFMRGFASTSPAQTYGLGWGGAIYALVWNYSITIDKCEFIANVAQKNGGAIWIKNELAPISIKNSKFQGNYISDTNNYSYFGDAVWIAGGAIIENSVFQNNGRAGYEKPIVVLQDGGPNYLKNSSIVNNLSSGPGLTLHDCVIAPCGLENSTIAFNAGLGVKFDNSISGPTTRDQELYNKSTFDNLAILNSTIANNTMVNTVYSNLWVSTLTQLDIENSVFQVTDTVNDFNCTVGAVPPAQFSSQNYSNKSTCWGNTMIVPDVMLGALSTDALTGLKTMPPLVGSPLLNTAVNCLPKDQLGNIRPASCDIGSREIP